MESLSESNGWTERLFKSGRNGCTMCIQYCSDCPGSRKLFPQQACDCPFNLTHQLTYCMSRRNDHYHMNVIYLNVIFYYLTARHAPHCFGKKFSQITSHTRIQDTATIFRYPHNMILSAICTVPRQSNLHTPIIAYRRLYIHPRASPWNSALRVVLNTIETILGRIKPEN